MPDFPTVQFLWHVKQHRCSASHRSALMAEVLKLLITWLSGAFLFQPWTIYVPLKVNRQATISPCQLPFFPPETCTRDDWLSNTTMLTSPSCLLTQSFHDSGLFFETLRSRQREFLRFIYFK